MKYLKLIGVVCLCQFLSLQSLAQDYSRIDFEIIEIIEDREDEFLIGSLAGIATDAEENIYLFDFVQNSVLKLNQQRELQGKILSEGRGPSELQSIYSYFLDKDKELIYIADRQNFRFMITNLEGKQIKSFPIHPNFTNPPMGIEYYNENSLLFKYYVSAGQTMRRVDGIDSLFHFHDSRTFERLFSIGDRTFINKKIGYESAEIGLMNRIMVGKVLFSDPRTLIYSPYIYNGSLLIYKRSNMNFWKFSESIKGKAWDLKPFVKIEIDDYQQNREEYRVKSARRISTSFSPDGDVAGYINLRSVGLFQLTNGLIVNFIAKESVKEDKQIQELHVDIYSDNLEFLGTSFIFEGENNELLRDVYWKDSQDNFYLGLESSRFNTKVIVFRLGRLSKINLD